MQTKTKSNRNLDLPANIFTQLSPVFTVRCIRTPSKSTLQPPPNPHTDIMIKALSPLRTQTITPTHIYLKIHLEIKGDHQTQLIDLPSIINSALRSLYGVVGAATISYQLESVHTESDVTVLRVPLSHYRRLWAALTLVSHVEKKQARFTVLTATPFWFALFDDGIF